MNPLELIVVALAVLLAAAYLVRRTLRKRRKKASAGCAGCGCGKVDIVVRESQPGTKPPTH